MSQEEYCEEEYCDHRPIGNEDQCLNCGYCTEEMVEDYKDRLKAAAAEIKRQEKHIESLQNKYAQATGEIEQLEAESQSMRNALNGAGVVVMGPQEWRWMEEGERDD